MNLIKIWNSLKGFKTFLVALITWLIIVSETLGSTNMTEGMCNVVIKLGELLGKEWVCNPTAIKVFFATIVLTLQIWLRKISNTPIFEKEPLN